MQQLRISIKSYLEGDGGHRAADLSRLSGVATATISRILNGKQNKVTSDTWMALHRAAPQTIPPPPMVEDCRRPLAALNRPASAGLMFIPIYDTWEGQWSLHGHQTGQAQEFLPCLREEVDSESFALRAPDQAMAPAILPTDLVVVVPSRALQNGNVVLAVNVATSDALIRRYRLVGSAVLLTPDNPQLGQGVVIENFEIFKLLKITTVIKKNI